MAVWGGRWSETGSGTRWCWRPRRGLWAISSPVGLPRVYRRISRFRRHLPGAKAGRGRSSGGDLPANWPILGRPAELHSAGHLGNPEIRTSGRGRVCGLSELRFPTSPSAALLGVPAKHRSRESGTLAEPPGPRFHGAICSRVGRRRVDRRVCDFPRNGSRNPDVGCRTSGGNPLKRGTPSRRRVYDVVVGGFAWGFRIERSPRLGPWRAGRSRGFGGDLLENSQESGRLEELRFLPERSGNPDFGIPATPRAGQLATLQRRVIPRR